MDTENRDYSSAAVCPAGALIAIDCLGGKLPSDIVVMVATLAFFGFACGEFGNACRLSASSARRRFAPPYPLRAGLLRPVAGCGSGIHH